MSADRVRSAASDHLSTRSASNRLPSCFLSCGRSCSIAGDRDVDDASFDDRSAEEELLHVETALSRRHDATALPVGPPGRQSHRPTRAPAAPHVAHPADADEAGSAGAATSAAAPPVVGNADRTAAELLSRLPADVDAADEGQIQAALEAVFGSLHTPGGCGGGTGGNESDAPVETAELWRRALTSMESAGAPPRLLDKVRALCANSLGRLGDGLRSQGRVEQALERYVEAEEMLRAAAATASFLSSSAEEADARAASGANSGSGLCHAAVAHAAGRCFGILERHPEAIEQLMRAAELRESFLGPRAALDLQLASMLKDIGTCHEHLSNHADAMAAYHRAEGICRAVASCGMGTGSAPVETGQGSTGDSGGTGGGSSGDSSDIGSAGDGVDVRTLTAALLRDRGVSFYNQGSLAAAIALFGRARAAYETAGSTLTRGCAALLYAMGACQYDEGNRPNAIFLFTSAKETLHMLGAEEMREYALAESALVACLLEEGRVAEARQLQTAAAAVAAAVEQRRLGSSGSSSLDEGSGCYVAEYLPPLRLASPTLAVQTTL